MVLISYLKSCLVIKVNANKIILVINQAFQVSLQNYPLTCILGFLDEELFIPHAQTVLSRLLYLAHKFILLNWIAPLPPTLKEWHIQVNTTLLRERHILKSRGTPFKFNKLWDPWLQVMGLAPIALVSLQILQGL